MRYFAFALCLLSATAGAEELCVPRGDWDRAFQRTDGWTGGDANYAVDLGDGNTLWLFADSWVGPVRDGKHAAGSRLVNNALAVHRTPTGGAAPAAEVVQFFWGADDEERHPTAFFRPDRERVKPRFGASGKSDDATWYWVADAAIVPGGAGKPRLVEFLWHVGRTKGDGVWAFAGVGGAVAIVENPSEPPPLWNLTQYDNPHVVPNAGLEEKPSRKAVTWGSALLVEGAWLYIYGTRASSGWDVELVLARAPANKVEQFDAWEFRSTEGWSRELSDLSPRATGLVSEFSVDRVTVDGQARYVLVQSAPIFGTQVMARACDAPDGRFSDSVAIYQVPDVDESRKYFTYAAKGHAHLSAPGKLLVSYILNSHDFSAMVNDANIYRPRFVELDLKRFVAEQPNRGE